jgi:putative peptidoglycan lipid II flippase
MLPAVIGLSVDQVNAFVDTICATFLAEGSVTALYNSNRLMQLPLALFGVAIATVSLPTMSEHCAEKDFRKLGETIGESLRMVLFIVTPASFGLIILAHPIVSLLFEHGRFTSFATSLTAKALWGYSAGLVAYSSVKILANAFYALQEPRIPVRVAVVSMLANVVLIVILMGPFGVLGLSCAAAISSWLNASWLFLLIRKRLGGDFIESGKIARTGLKTLFCSAAMSLFVLGLLGLGPGLPAFLKVVIGISGGAAVFALCAMALKMDEQKSILNMVRARENAGPPDAEE